MVVVRMVLTVLLTLAVSSVSATANAASQDVTRVAIVGDSMTTGYGVPPGQGYADLLESDAAGDNVLPLAVNGHTVRRWLTVSLPELDQLSDWQPTTVLIALGGNDWSIGRRTADYQTDLTYLTWHIRSRVPNARVIYWHYYPIGIPQNPAVCDVWPCTPAASTWANYATAMRDAAIRNQAGYIDDSVSSPSGKPWSSFYGPDRVHLTAAGHQQLFQSIRQRLLSCC